jgi:hypothetical protein
MAPVPLGEAVTSSSSVIKIHTPFSPTFGRISIAFAFPPDVGVWKRSAPVLGSNEEKSPFTASGKILSHPRASEDYPRVVVISNWGFGFRDAEGGSMRVSPRKYVEAGGKDRFLESIDLEDTFSSVVGRIRYASTKLAAHQVRSAQIK